MAPKIKIGDTIWHFDENRRKYTEAEDGKVWGRLIFSAHFEPWEIIGEEKRSWIVEHIQTYGAGRASSFKKKIGKNTIDAHPFGGEWNSEGRRAARIWIKENAPAVESAIRRCHDIAALTEIARLLVEAGALDAKALKE